MTRKQKLASALVSLVALGTIMILVFLRKPAPLGDMRPIHPQFQRRSQVECNEFMGSSFTIDKKVKALPAPIIEIYTEQGGSRPVLANPGNNFEKTDVVEDSSSLPIRRLVFAGVSGDHCFLHYEHGGMAYYCVVGFFKVDPKSGAQLLWGGYCDDPASSLADLRSKVANGKCSANTSPPFF